MSGVNSGIDVLIDVLKTEINKKREKEAMNLKAEARAEARAENRAEARTEGVSGKGGSGKKEAAQTKICPQCGEEKELNTDNWYRKPKLKSGWSSWCKDCLRKLAKENYDKRRKAQKGKAKKNKVSGKKKAQPESAKVTPHAPVTPPEPEIAAKPVLAVNPAPKESSVSAGPSAPAGHSVSAGPSAPVKNTPPASANEPEPDVLKLSDYMQDGQGRLVHKDNVKEIDKIRDALVRDIVKGAMDLQDKMVKFKTDTMAEINSFVDLSAREYGEKRGGTKGNLCFYTYDMKYKVQVQVSEYLVFDERLQLAKSMIDKCFVSWTKSSSSEVKTIINDAFAVNQEGKINIGRILSLRRLEINDPLWQKAMQAISDSLQVAGSKSYMRIYERKKGQGQWQNISLDMAAL